jgi:putative membrane protein
VLWALVSVYAAVIFANTLHLVSVPIPVVLLVTILFALIHGAVRYGWAGIVTFIVISLVVSNILENTSILTGFPFGHYHYTDLLGPKLLLVPLLIGPAYVATGYLAWVLANVLVGDVRRGAGALTTVGVPLIGAFLMAMWDLSFDPGFSTVRHFWIWEQGGGYFGVPMTNYLGWLFTVYVFLQLFALVIRSRQLGHETMRTLPRSYYVQAVVMYAVLGLSYALAYVALGTGTSVTDAAGVVWNTKSIAEAAATVSIYTMVFAAGLTALKLVQGLAEARETSLESASAVLPIPERCLSTREREPGGVANRAH